jgi:signal transduction histidine kinase
MTTAPPIVTADPRSKWPDVAVGLTVGVFGIWQSIVLSSTPPAIGFVVSLGFGIACMLHRLAPGLALLLVWFACAVQVFFGFDVMAVQLGTALVAFGCARYGSVLVLWLSGASIPVGTLFALAFARWQGIGVTYNYRLALIGLVAALVLALPWFLGLALRLRESSVLSGERQLAAEADRLQAETARSAAEEIAELRAEQTRLARDVHDVVGHSLAVILAQAESAQYLPEDDTARLRQTMANIAGSARQSLRDVRHVLAPEAGTADAGLGGLASLVEGVRAAGNDVASSVVGTPRPLPPELDVVAFRVLQEMLTNALKHGRRGARVAVEQHWEGELRIEVRNVAGAVDDAVTQPVAQVPAHAPAESGLGIEGMRRRLESVGGRLDVRRRLEDGTPTFTVTAWIPLRPVVVPGGHP